MPTTETTPQALITIPTSGVIVGLMPKSSCQCCGKTHIDTILIDDGKTTVRMGTHCVSSNFVFKHQHKTIQPAVAKRRAEHAQFLIRTNSQSEYGPPINLTIIKPLR